MIGTLLNNRYQITKELGEGGFGKTFLAIDTHSPAKRQCVIKQLKPINNDPKTEQLIKDRFGREAVVLETLGQNAPGNQIPRLDAYFNENNQFYLVQEFVEGESLRQKLLNGVTFSENEVKNILISILPVLQYVHNQRIIHRDIKPENIIIRKSDNKPVLIDFGAVKETLSTTVTTGGNVISSIIIGTQGYMSPEQGSGRPVHSSDLYSLAMTLIELLTGKMPNQLDINQQTGEIDISWKVGINVSRELGEILDKAISYTPRDRYSSASLMLNALQPQTTQGFTQPTNNYSPQSTEVSANPIYQQPIQQQYQQPQPYQERERQQYQQTPINGNNQSFPQWLTAVIMGSIIGAFVLGGVYLSGQNKPQTVGQNNTSPTPTPTNSSNPTPTNSPTPEPTATPVQNSISREEAKALVWRWLEAKRTLFASPYDQQLGASITTGKAYIDNIQGPNSKGEPESSLEWLRNRGFYYRFTSQNVGDIRGFEVDGNNASIQVIVTEYRTLYSNTTENSGGTYLSTYYLKNDNGVWKISDYKTERY